MRYKPNSKATYKVYTYKNGATYTGEWIGGFRSNRGTMQWPDGAKYEGEWRDG